MEGHPVVAPNRAARGVPTWGPERFRDGTESRGHGTRALSCTSRGQARNPSVSPQPPSPLPQKV